jgi:hypothetical protein
MRKTLIATATLLAAATGQAAIDVSDGSFSYFQDFDSLTTSTTATAWANDSTLPGWSLFISTGGPAATIAADTGGSNAGTFRSYGPAGSSDRALGALGSGGAYFGSPLAGSVAGWIAVAFTNTGSLALDSFTVQFDGEQWRNGGNTSPQPMVLEYGFGASFAGVANWLQPGGSFDWVSPVATSTAAAVNGNTVGLVADVGGTILTDWTPGATLWLRWVELNDPGNDHGLAIDNFRFSVTAVPEPGTWAMLLAGLGAVGLIARRRG